MSYGVKAEKAMTKRPITITAEKTIADACKLMVKSKIGSLLVVENDSLKGIITDTDMVRELGASGKKTDTKIGDVMTKGVFTISIDTDLYDVARTMAKWDIRRLPVVDASGKLLGLVTEKDLLRTQPSVIDVLLDTMVRMHKRYGVALSEGVSAEKVIEIINECVEEAKLNNPKQSMDLQGIHVDAAGGTMKREAHAKAEVIVAMTCLHPYSLVAFSELVVPIVKRKLKIREYTKN